RADTSVSAEYRFANATSSGRRRRRRRENMSIRRSVSTTSYWCRPRMSSGTFRRRTAAQHTPRASTCSSAGTTRRTTSRMRSPRDPATGGRVEATGACGVGRSGMKVCMRIGVLTGGGDCPGLNAVIRALVRRAEREYGHELLGFRHGWRGLIEDETMPLTVAKTRGLIHRGGTILGTSRTNPFRREGGAEAVLMTLLRHGIDALVAIGGEDTLGVARQFGEHGVDVV